MAAVSIKLNPVGMAVLLISFGIFCVYIFGVPDMFKSHPNVSLKSVLCVSVELARKGGERVRSIAEAHNLNSEKKGMTKEGASEMKTDGDIQSHRAIFYGIQKAFPGVQVVSEEQDTAPIDLKPIEEAKKSLNEVDNIISSDENVPLSDLTIWIDPLDATQEYIEGLTDYVTVMICAAVRGEPILGVIYNPFTDKTCAMALLDLSLS